MSRYVRHPHGLVIGSGNIFFVHDAFAEDPLEVFRDGYRAIVSVKYYTYDTISTANVGIQTPVEQLLYRQWREKTGETFGKNEIQIAQTFVGLSDRGRRLLERIGPQVEVWDTYTKSVQSRCPPIFFRRRKDALTLVRKLSDILKGIRYADY